ncbi:Do family serine endopeptidase [Pontibacter sp. G13]|uniref:Do family serine endopeptidase n=1 Tax=Pontibacter sp. G13 TaxID=3074898 RepID=UPI00288C1B0D|nr:Do family serine endopeptidase [Pontibacter sp. G13]WNJ16307.1 Do family serine endopeptidase [Pontibacter sp. G13]
MSRKTLFLSFGIGFLLILVGSLVGAGMYAYFFGPEYVYVPKEPIPATFSRYENPPSRPQTTSSTSRMAVPGELPDFVVAAESARPAVVHIRSQYNAKSQRREADFFSNPFRDFFDDDMMDVPQGVASGSGVLISEDGYIVTNNHVIQDADEVEITLFDNRSFPAKVIGTDISTDLALLKIEGEQLPFLPFGNSDQVKVGQWVLAVGNPMDLTSTVTAGIVSAKGRNINLLRNDSEYAIESFIQTDAAVNKGNSGGALVNIDGELVGINTAIASRTGYYAGYSFAIPASIARKVMEDLLTYGEVRRGFLGVSIQPVDARLAKQYDLSTLKGAYVSRLDPALGAAEAGLMIGDVIVSVNGREVNNSSELQEQVSRYRPGDLVTILAFRGSHELQFEVPLKQLATARSSRVNPELAVEVEFEGNRFRAASEEELEALGINFGAVILEVGEQMAEHEIAPGFVITSINGERIESLEDLQDQLATSGEYVTIKGLYERGMNASYSFSW